MASLGIQLESKKQVDEFCQTLSKEAEQLLSKFFPEKIEQLQMLLKTSFSCDDLASLKAPLDIPIPDPAKEEAKEEAKRKKKEEVSPTPPGFQADHLNKNSELQNHDYRILFK
ncbi:hypothetical protein XENOCAPTIV_022994 [Xenoophorus captivus]|uniref:Proteasome activator PA28 N-terminal domain-containing protein n=2 Tax=Goodeidae TaxID=28758 RepID=A0ABV0S1Y6_9TELE|nr:hypothetical protein [Characodon lateralis]